MIELNDEKLFALACLVKEETFFEGAAYLFESSEKIINSNKIPPNSYRRWLKAIVDDVNSLLELFEMKNLKKSYYIKEYVRVLKDKLEEDRLLFERGYIYKIKIYNKVNSLWEFSRKIKEEVIIKELKIEIKKTIKKLNEIN